MDNQNSSIKDSLISDYNLQDNNTDSICSFPVCKKTITIEKDEEFSLPDYLPEIRKLIRVDIKPCNVSKFVSESGVQLNGNIGISAIYVGMEGGFCLADFQSDMNLACAFENDDVLENIMVSTDIYPEATLSRVVTSRKLNIKYRLCVKINAIADKKLHLSEDIPEDYHIQKLDKKVKFCKEYRGESEEIVLNDEMDNLGNGVKCIAFYGDVFIDNVQTMDSYVQCKGNVIVKILACKDCDDEIPYTTFKKIPFDEIIEIDGISENDKCFAKGICTSVKIEQDEGENPSDKLHCSAKIVLTANVFKNKEISYVCDAYSTDCESESIKEKYTLPTLKSCFNSNFTFNTNAQIKGSPFENSINSDDFRFSVIDTCANAVVDEVTFEEDKYKINGKCRFNVVYSDENYENQSEIFFNEIELPYKYEFRADENSRIEDLGNLNYDVSVCPLNPRARFDSDKIYFDCEFLIGACITENKKIEAVVEIREGEKIKSCQSGFTVCYPEKDDSLWSIAKRYRAFLQETAKENGIDISDAPDAMLSLENKKYLIV